MACSIVSLVSPALALCIIAGIGIGSASAQSPDEPTVEETVLQQIRDHPLNGGTLANLNADEAFLRRVADRMIRSSYQEQFHVVVRDEDFASSDDATGARDDHSTVPTAANDQSDSSESRTVDSWIRKPLVWFALIAAALLFVAVYLRLSSTPRPQAGSKPRKRS